MQQEVATLWGLRSRDRMHADSPHGYGQRARDLKFLHNVQKGFMLLVLNFQVSSSFVCHFIPFLNNVDKLDAIKSNFYD